MEQATFPYKKGDSGPHIRALHRKLARVDRCKQYLTDPSTSNYSPATEAAILAFKGNKPGQHGQCDEQTWRKLDAEAGSVFAEVWQYELDALAQKLDPQRDDPLVEPVESEENLIGRAHAANLQGLAFSGGGIRSATFNLGILQALAELDLLKRFDYLSTVSGGGYIGGWFSRWLSQPGSSLEKVQKGLTPGSTEKPRDGEREEIRFLRKYSNYLTPKTGLFSADTWALLATYFRNTTLNMAVLTALLAAAMTLPYLLVHLAGYGAEHRQGFAAIATAAALWTVYYIAVSINIDLNPKKQGWLHTQTQKAILWRVVMPLMLAAFTGGITIWCYRPELTALMVQQGLLKWPASVSELPLLLDQLGVSLSGWLWLLVPGTAYFAAWGAGWLTAWRNNRPAPKEQSVLALSPTRSSGEAPELRPFGALKHVSGHFCFAAVAFGMVTLLLASSVSAFDPPATTSKEASIEEKVKLASFGMSYMLSLFGIAMILTIGLIGRLYKDKDREWWSRQGGWTAICTLGYLGLASMSLYGPALAGYIHAHLPDWGKAVVASSWLGTVVAGVLAGRSGKTGGEAGGGNRFLEWLAALAPPIFTAGALLIISTLTYLALLPGSPDLWGHQTLWSAALAEQYNGISRITLARGFGALTVLVVAGVVLSLRVDINKFSMHMMYRNRLVRAYLGASNPERHPHPFTGFDEADDIPLGELRDGEHRLLRPLHIVNTAVNITAGEELAWQTRKAASFTFSPAFCGFELPENSSGRVMPISEDALRGCYRLTTDYRAEAGAFKGQDTGISLGMAMAVSGAAVNPNMGYHSSPSLAFLMTLFNVRLGRWFANPMWARWRKTSPSLGIGHLLNELLGLSDTRSKYLHLSDGGHFENLGVYELVRRRCKLIVAVDASADHGMRFEDLGNAVRKCATDLHIDIDIDVANVECIEPTPYSKAYYVIGDIRYSHTDPGKSDGKLLYIKPCLLGNERADIKNYKKTNGDFPHQSTADQWFDETQFESYRWLGYRVGKIALERGLAEIAAAPTGPMRETGPKTEPAPV